MKRIKKTVVLACILLTFLLSSCGTRSSCYLLAVAGGAQHCAEMENR